MPSSLKDTMALAEALQAERGNDASSPRVTLFELRQPIPMVRPDASAAAEWTSDLESIGLTASDLTVPSDLAGCSKPLLVMLHGTPGSWDIFARQFASPDLREAFHIIAIERPGWGRSRYPDGRVEPSLAQQAADLTPALSWLGSCRTEPLLLLGHSYGATLLPYLALELQERGHSPAQLFLLAGNYSPSTQKARWYNRAADWRPVQWLIDEGLERSNEEMLALNPQLAFLDTLFPKLLSPMHFIQGDSDKLVSPKNADYIAALISAEHFSVPVQLTVLENEGHLFLLEKPARLTARLIEAVANDDYKTL